LVMENKERDREFEARWKQSWKMKAHQLPLLKAPPRRKFSRRVSREEMDKLKDELNEMRTKADEYLDGWQRSRAEFANYKRRVERDQAQVYQMAAGSILKRYLDVIDDLERALKNYGKNHRHRSGYHQLGRGGHGRRRTGRHPFCGRRAPGALGCGGQQKPRAPDRPRRPQPGGRQPRKHHLFDQALHGPQVQRP
jgi:hypothetical protein